MPVYSVNQDTTIGEFLRLPYLSPPIENPDARIGALISCQGIVLYTRSGIRTVITSEGFQAGRGDFVVVASQCSTGQSQTIVAALQPTDYAFITPALTNDFGREAEIYMNRRPATKAIADPAKPESLYGVLSIIKLGNYITTPINDIIIVSHANAGGFLFFKLTEDSDNDFISYNELDDYLNNSSRPQMTSNLIRNNGRILIRGCNIGKEPRFLRLVKRLFGGQATVTAPKHCDSFVHYNNAKITYTFEHMLYNFEVHNKTPINRNQLLHAFINHSPQYSDIFGNTITAAQYNDWIPTRISNPLIEVRHSCSVPLPAAFVNREFQYKMEEFFGGKNAYDIPLTSNPPDDQKIDILKNNLQNNAIMKSTYPFPQYEQFGYKSVDDFVDNLAWNFSWNDNDKKLLCSGKRHRYRLLIPIADGNNSLFLNSFKSGDNQYVHHQLLETDSRFFETV